MKTFAVIEDTPENWKVVGSKLYQVIPLESHNTIENNKIIAIILTDNDFIPSALVGHYKCQSKINQQ